MSRLFFKLLAVIAGILVVALVTVSLLTGLYFQADIERRVQENNLYLNEIIAQKLRSDLRQIHKTGRFAADLVVGRSATSRGVLEDASDPAFLAVLWPVGGQLSILSMLMNPDYKVEPTVFAAVQAYLEENVGSLIRGEQTVIRRYRGGPLAGLPHEVMILVAGPAGDGAYFIAGVDGGALLSAFEAASLAETYLVSLDGELLAHSRLLQMEAATDDNSSAAQPAEGSGNLIGELRLRHEVLIGRMIGAELSTGQIHYTDPRGTQTYLGAYHKLGDRGLGVLSTVPEDLAFAGARNIWRRNLLITLMMLVLGFAVVYVVSRGLTHPLEELERATEGIARGEYGRRLEPRGTDEIGRLTASFNRMSEGLGERERIKTMLGKLVDRDVAERLLRDEHKLGGEERQSAVLYCDLRNLTSLSETMDPPHMVEFLNEYLTLIVASIRASGGVVDKFIGDAILAHWGAVDAGLSSPEVITEAAIDAALTLRASLAEYNRRETTASGYPKPEARMGVGINTGPVISGLIGSEDRQEFTVIGDEVNLASRVESITLRFNCDILISQNSYNQVKDIFRVEYLPAVEIKGKGQPQKVYAVLGRIDDIQSPGSLEELRRYHLLFGPADDTAEEAVPREKEYVVTFRD